MRFSLLFATYPSTNIPSGFVMLAGKLAVLQVTVCVSPTFQTVLAVGLVIGGATTSLAGSGTVSTHETKENNDKARVVNIVNDLFVHCTFAYGRAGSVAKGTLHGWSWCPVKYGTPRRGNVIRRYIIACHWCSGVPGVPLQSSHLSTLHTHCLILVAGVLQCQLDGIVLVPSHERMRYCRSTRSLPVIAGANHGNWRFRSGSYRCLVDPMT